MDKKSSNRKYETTLESDVLITHKRRDGNTTRLVDKAIQILFRGSVCIVMDHHEMGRNRMANRMLFDGILNRLESEHKFLLLEKRVRIDQNKLEIYFIEKNIIEKVKMDGLIRPADGSCGF